MSSPPSTAPLLLQRLHVLGHVESEDVLPVHVSVQLLPLGVVAGESLLRVGDVESSVYGALQSSEHLSSGGGPGESDIQASPEGSGSIVLVLNVEHSAVHVGVALVDSVQLELLEDSPGQEEPGAVSSSIVGESNLDSVPGQLVQVGSTDNDVSLQPGVRDLAAHIGVGGADDHPVLGGVVLVLVLDDETLAGKVVGPALPPPAELDLVPLEVGLVLYHFNKRHFDLRSFSCRSESSNISL